jgi:hypothetical protein
MGQVLHGCAKEADQIAWTFASRFPEPELFAAIEKSVGIAWAG